MTDPQNPGDAADESQIYADPRMIEVGDRRKQATRTLMMIVSACWIGVIAIGVLTFVTETLPQNLGLWLMLAFIGCTAALNVLQQRRIKKIAQDADVIKAQIESQNGGSAPQL